MAYYYAVERSPECLVHDGIKGMRWGIRKRRKGLSNKKRRSFLTRQDLKDASKAAALSLIMGPYASMYVSSRRAVADAPQKKRKRK